MAETVAGSSWRWREALLTGTVCLVPEALGRMGLAGTSISGDSSGLRTLAVSALFALVTGSVLSLPLESREAAVVKTSTARRVALTIAALASAAIALDAVGVAHISFLPAAVSLVLIWVGLGLSTTFSPLEVAGSSGSPIPMSWLPVRTTSKWAVAAKRAIDIVGAAFLLVLASPILMATAVAIKLFDGGDVFFRQTRVGRNGVSFEMIKFRSMVLDAEALKADLADQSDRSGPLFKMTNDPRITPVGRIIRELSVDELPQLLNILRGDMSLVGPRPALPSEEVEFDAMLRRRTIVPPGLTGLWQAEARSDADFGRFRDLDLRYVSTSSIVLDIWILLATATEVAAAAVSAPLRSLGIDIASCDGITTPPVTNRDEVIDLTDSPARTIDLRPAPLDDSPQPTGGQSGPAAA